jgi:hypothetical protein
LPKNVSVEQLHDGVAVEAGVRRINPIAAAIRHRVEFGQDRSTHDIQAAAKSDHPAEPVVCERA